MGLDQNNKKWVFIFNRHLLELFLHNITLANMFALIGAIFFVATLLTHTMVPLRVANASRFAHSSPSSGALTGDRHDPFFYLFDGFHQCLPSSVKPLSSREEGAHRNVQGDMIDGVRQPVHAGLTASIARAIS